MSRIIKIDTDSIIIEHDGVTEWSDCAECGAHIDPASEDLGDDWDGSCPRCGAAKGRVGLRLDTGDIRRTCGCGKAGYLAANEDGEVEHQGRLYQMGDDLDAGEPMVAGEDGVARCADCASGAPEDEADAEPTGVHCECGAWSSESCLWTGRRSDTVLVDYAPPEGEAARTAAEYLGTPGSQPGTLRLRVERSCADRMLRDCPEAVRVVEE